METDEQPKNRRARRAAEKGAQPAEGGEIKDRNQRLRAEAAAERRKVREDRVAQASAEGLDASERLDDVFLRSTDAAGKFLGRYGTILQSLVVLAAAGGMAYLIWGYRTKAEVAKVGDRLAAALDAQNGRLSSDTSPRTTTLGLSDTRPEFADAAAQQKASLDKWQALETGTSQELGQMAELAQAGILLDSGETARAKEKFAALTSAKAPTVRARAEEGLLFCLEAERDLDKALATALSLKDIPGQADLGTYHEARLRLAKGERDKALELLKPLKEKLSKGVGPFDRRPFLLNAVEDLDKTLNPKSQAASGGLTPEAMEMLRQLKAMQAEGQESPPQLPLGPVLPLEEPSDPPASDPAGDPSSSPAPSGDAPPPTAP